MRAVYEKLYSAEAYREHSPGELCVPDFLTRVKVAPDDVILDIGCGTGRATKALGVHAKAIGLDFVDAREAGVEFFRHDLKKPLPVDGTIGFCCDVMEHIPPRDVKRVLLNIMRAVDTCYFQICTVPDFFGGGGLHLTVKPFSWWARRLSPLGMIRYARQEPKHCVFVVQRSITVREMDKSMRLMIPEEEMRGHILENIRRGYRECTPHEVQQREVAILAGGPSLELFDRPDLPIITANGAYNWAVARGYKPSAQMIVDPRELNKRFTQPVIGGCKYLIGSQCHPEVAKAVPKDQVYLWHSGDLCGPAFEEYAKETDEERAYYPVFGGSTVMLRGLSLLVMLGFRKFHIWGFDSCITDRHHAYPQPENDTEKVMDILIGGRRFKCHAWMAVQAQEFIDTTKHLLPDDVQMIVYGDGLIAHILRTGAHFYKQQRAS